MTAGREVRPTYQRHSLNSFADRWEVCGDCISCLGCGRTQQISWAHDDFPHTSRCKNSGSERNPWKTLADLISAEINKESAA